MEMIYRAKAPHVGCSLGMVELLAALYFKIMKADDRFILSKGHGCPALYAVLGEKGLISRKILDGFAKDAGTLEGHPTRDLKLGIEASSGSVGHGLSLAAGLALAGKVDGKNYRAFVFLGDGELDEGSNWEAIMFASQYKLDNLVAIIDKNQLQILGKTSEVINLEPLAEKWRAFNWEVKEVDGHNFAEIIKALEGIPFRPGKPSCLIANTIKGKGVSFMENELRWHDKYPDEEEYKKALSELS